MTMSTSQNHDTDPNALAPAPSLGVPAGALDTHDAGLRLIARSLCYDALEDAPDDVRAAFDRFIKLAAGYYERGGPHDNEPGAAFAASCTLMRLLEPEDLSPLCLALARDTELGDGGTSFLGFGAELSQAAEEIINSVCELHAAGEHDRLATLAEGADYLLTAAKAGAE